MILLIGCGNLQRRDDGAGLLLVRRIRRRCRRPDLEAVACQQLTPELAPRLADPAVKLAIFADAAVETGAPRRTLLRYLAAEQGQFSLGHHLGPAALLSLAARLYGRHPPAWLVTVPAEDFAFGARPAAGTRRHLVRAEAEVCRLLAAI